MNSSLFLPTKPMRIFKHTIDENTNVGTNGGYDFTGKKVMLSEHLLSFKFVPYA
jgi:hypothetical protein